MIFVSSSLGEKHFPTKKIPPKIPFLNSLNLTCRKVVLKRIEKISDLFLDRKFFCKLFGIFKMFLRSFCIIRDK